MTNKEANLYYRFEKVCKLNNLPEENKNDVNYLIYSLTEPGQRMCYKYLGLISKTQLNKLKNIDELNNWLNNYALSFEYDLEYYYPLYRNGTFEEFVILDYLRDIGFKHSTDNFFSYKPKDIYKGNTTEITISINGLDSFKEIPEIVNINLWTGKYSWVSVEVPRNVKAIKEGIDSLIKPLLVTESVANFNTSEKLLNTIDIDILLQSVNTQSLAITSQDYKQELKAKLLAMAETLN